MTALDDGIRALSLILLAIGLLSIFGPLDIWWHAGWSIPAVYAHWWPNVAGGLGLIVMSLILRRNIA